MDSNFGLVLASQEELREIFSAPIEYLRKLVIAGYVNTTNQSIVIYTAIGEKIEVPIYFIENKKSRKYNDIDYSDFSIIDHGNTLKFGSFEADASFLVEEFSNKGFN